jgi:hypothetical protein
MPNKKVATHWSGRDNSLDGAHDATSLTPLESALARPTRICTFQRTYKSPSPPATPLSSAPTSRPVSAESKRLITPLKSALTEISPATPLESALPKTLGVGDYRPLSTKLDAPTVRLCCHLHSTPNPRPFSQLPALSVTNGVRGPQSRARVAREPEPLLPLFTIRCSLFTAHAARFESQMSDNLCAATLHKKGV